MRDHLALSSVVMSIRLLVWPETCRGEPLEPEEPGWVVGWTLEDGVVVCADICPLDDRVDYDANLVVGRWKPTETTKVSDTIASFVMTVDGPWWKSAPAGPREQQQLLLYQRAVQYHHDTPWMSGHFSNLLRHINKARSILDCGDGRDSSSVEHEDRLGSKTSSRHAGHDEENEDESSSLPRRFCRFVAKNSMLIQHGRAIDDLVLQIPAIQLRSLCRGLTNGDEVDAYVERFNKAVSIAFNMVIGTLAGVFLFYRTDDITTFLQYAWKVCYQDLLRDNIRWLDSFPAGFKLNVVLTANMGREITTLIDLHDSICGMLWSFASKTLIMRAVGLVSAVFGSTALIALLHDILILSTIHIAAIATCFRALHGTQLYLLASLWRLFRGKKKNILRHRTDTMEEDSMQLLLGMILFTACLFLFTTILVYYAFFAVLYVSIQILGVVLWFLYVTISHLPIGKMWLRTRHPECFTERVYLEDLPSKSREVTRLCPVYRSCISILSDPLSDYFTAMFSSIPRYVVELLKGKPCTIRETCLSRVTIATRKS